MPQEILDAIAALESAIQGAQASLQSSYAQVYGAANNIGEPADFQELSATVVKFRQGKLKEIYEALYAIDAEISEATLGY